VELVACGNPAVVDATEDKANRKMLRLLLADIKESLLVEVIAVLEPFNIASKCLSCDSKTTLHRLLNFARFQCVAFWCFVAYEYF